MILMTKKEAERQLKKQLTNQEYNKFIYDLNFKNKKETHKKVQIKTVKAPLNFNDAKNEFLQVNNLISQWKDKEEKFFSSRYNKIFICKNSYNHLAYLTWSWDYDNIRNKDMIIREATKEDLLLIIEVYKQQIENFKKRLNTYLKRYGLSKLRTWTYLVD